MNCSLGRLTPVGCALCGLFILLVGCTKVNTPTHGVNTAIHQISTLGAMADERNLKLSDYEGVAMISAAKVGTFGFGVNSWAGSVFIKDPHTQLFGPPFFVDAKGPSFGLIFGGAMESDLMLLFRNRNDAINFAQRKRHWHFTNEIAVGKWGAKHMTVRGADPVTSSSGLSMGLIEIEYLTRNDDLDNVYHELYGTTVTVEQISHGTVPMPQALKHPMTNLNSRMFW